MIEGLVSGQAASYAILGKNAIVRGKVAASPRFGAGYWETDKRRALHETA